MDARRLSLVLVICVFGFVETVSAQVTTGTILGTVSDSTGAVISGTTITIKNADTGISRTVTTDAAGRYRAPQLGLGRYEVTAETAGFQTVVRSGITLTVAQEAVVDFTLQVGAVTERITVLGEASLVQTTTTEVSGLVDEVRIRELPLNGRSWEKLALLLPAVNALRTTFDVANTGFTTKMTAAGGRINSNTFLLDGTDISDSGGASAGSVAGTLLGVDTIREFKVLTHNYGAEYGKTSGAIITAVSRSGTNELHGSVFEFLRNNNLDARNFFDPTEGPPQFKRNQFGFTVGGPIKKDRTFYFGSYEGLRERLGQTLRAAVPNQLAHQGILPVRNEKTGQVVLTNVGVNPAVKPYLDLYPLPNERDFNDGTGEHVFGFSKPTDEDYFTVRADHQLSSKDSFFVRYTFDDARFTAARPLPLWTLAVKSRSQFMTIQETRILSNSAVNTARFAFNRTTPRQDSVEVGKIPHALSFRPGQPMGIMVIGGGQAFASVGGISDFGPYILAPAIYFQNTIQESDDLLYTRGRHSLKMGVNIERFQLNYEHFSIQFGQYNFGSLADFLAGFPSSFLNNTVGSYGRQAFRQTMVGMYLQDDFQVHPRLTLNLGVRYEFVTVPNEIHGNVGNLKSLTSPTLTVGNPVIENPSLRNVAPRVGLAWDLTGKGKTSLRAAFGMYHDQYVDRSYISHTSPPLRDQRVVIPYPSPIPFPNADPLLTIRGLVSAPAVLMPSGTPTALHYSLGLQHEVQSGTVVEVGYVGSHGYHLHRYGSWNVRIPSIGPDGRKIWKINNPMVNPNFAPGGGLATTDTNSWYNGLQVKAVGTFSKGLRLEGVYTFSKSIDEHSKNHTAEGDGDDDTLDVFDRKINRGLSNFDVRHNFTLNFSYELTEFGQTKSGLAKKLLHGWEFNSIATFSSGTPFTIDAGFGRSLQDVIPRFTGFPDRPNLKPGASNNPVLGGPDRYFDPTAFALQPEGTFGNLGRNTAIGPGLASLDASLTKNTRFGETRNLQFRFEMFNILNHANFALPGRQVFNPDGTIQGNVGRITRTVTSSRQIQFASKFIF